MTEIVRRMTWDQRRPLDADALLTREWLVTNGLGGSASGTVAGVATRRFHGLLVAALPAPHGRIVMLNHLAEQLRLPDDRLIELGGTEAAEGAPSLPGAAHLVEFRLELGLPIWRYEAEGYKVEKRIIVPHGQNTVHVTYRLLAGPGPVRLELRPSLHFRAHEGLVDQQLPEPYLVTALGNRYEVSGPPDLPPLRLAIHGAPGVLALDGGLTYDVRYRVEDERGYDARGPLWSPGVFSVTLTPGAALTPRPLRGANIDCADVPLPTVGEGETTGDPRDYSPLPVRGRGAGGEGSTSVTLIASAEPWQTVLALSPDEAARAEHQRRHRLLQAAPPAARSGPAAELVLAVDQFIITPAGRTEDLARAQAAGDQVRTVIAGYHWFTDWGRDTMISLEGLTLATGRHAEAGSILRMFARHVKDGLIPNMFPEGENEGLYHTADATLWFFHALDRYLRATDDRATLQQLLPILRDIVEHHIRGTDFGIGVDPADGLLRQGAEGYQLTWMDAKVDDWVVTPRRGKAVEINALWHNALCLLAGWLSEEGDQAAAQAVGSPGTELEFAL